MTVGELQDFLQSNLWLIELSEIIFHLLLLLWYVAWIGNKVEWKIFPTNTDNAQVKNLTLLR